MTEQEAIYILRNSENISDVQVALKVAIKAVEEIQQYRAIGTINEFKNWKEDWLNKFDLLIEYRKIGTVEECREAREKQKEAKNRCKDCAGCTQWKCDCSNVRREAINEFADKLKTNYEDDEDIYAILSDNDTYSYTTSCVLFEKYIDIIAEQLKDGGANE